MLNFPKQLGRVGLMSGGIAIVLLCLRLPAGAGYVDNYSKWREMTEEMKLGYAMSLYDVFSSLIDPADPKSWAVARGMAECGSALQLSNDMIVDAIDNFYGRSAENWGVAPMSAFLKEVKFGACRMHVDRLLIERGFQALPK